MLNHEEVNVRALGERTENLNSVLTESSLITFIVLTCFLSLVVVGLYSFVTCFCEFEMETVVTCLLIFGVVELLTFIS